MIKDLKENERIIGDYLITNASKGSTNAGTPYFNLTFQDASGTIEARKWEVAEGDDDIFVVGNVISAEADVIKYKNVFQLKVLKGKKLAENDIVITQFIPNAPVPQNVLSKKLLTYLAEIEDRDIKRVIEEILRRDFNKILTYPAASRNHHEYASGLLHHIVTMLDCMAALAKIYPTLDKDYLYAGTILHDLGKLIELSGPVVFKYTVRGKLVGHISLMSATLHEICRLLDVNEEKCAILQHLVLSHHGQQEFGSPVPPLIKEAEVLSLIDNLDARINMIDKALNDVPEGEFSPRLPALEGRSFYKIKK